MVGAAIHVQESEDQITAISGGGLQNTLTVLTIDASAEFGGANVYGALVYANADTNGTPPASDFGKNPWGFEVGGGYYLTEDWELFGRYEFADLDGGALISDLNVISFGVNKYFAGQNAKWTTDFGFGIDQLPRSIAVTGWRVDNTNEDGQFVFRSQFQLMF